MAGVKRGTDFFEVNITPKAKKLRESDPPAVLTLAPFALIPKVCFSDVRVNHEAVSCVLLRNPSDLHTEIQLELSDDLQGIGIELSSTQFCIPPSTTETLEVRWKPLSAIRSRGKISVKHTNGNKKFSYITVSCSSVGQTQGKGIQKKPLKKSGASTKSFANKSKPKTVTFSDSGKIPPCNVVVPIRRETYEVPKPASFIPSIPTIRSQSPNSYSLSISQVTIDEDLESNFCSSTIVSSSPQQLKGNETMKVIREPLKEYNYNIRPTTLLKKEDIFIERLKYGVTVPDYLLETPDNNFDRDSLDSPITRNDSNSPSFEISSFYLSRVSPVSVKNEPFVRKPVPVELEPASSTKDRSFYLCKNDTNNLTFDQDDFSFSLSVNPFISDNRAGVSDKTDPDHYMKEVQSRNTSFVITRSTANEYVNSSVCSTVKSDTSNVVSSKKDLENVYPLNCPSASRAQQPLSFEISPARPVFRRGVSEIGLSRFTEERKKTQPRRPSTPEFFSHQNFEIGKLSLYDEPDYLLHPYGVTAISDPFSKHAVYPREWLEKLELQLIKWLNSLLTPPIELGNIIAGVDVQKLWDQSTANSLKIAPSKETACKDYVLSDGSRMTALRKIATSLAQSEDIKRTIYQIRGKIDTGFLSVKDDINLYKNQGARVKLVQMCMYYNPLWLRIALEVIYEQVIPVHENNIHRGLVYFLKNHFLSNEDIRARNTHAKSNHPKGPNFMLEMNNYIVLKFLTLIFFLDQAKMRKIIPYDPCLFCKNSPIKESEGMLNEFIKEFLKCVGQFKKTLKALGYNLQYRQTFLDEFDYGLSSHLDLRDGVRLTRTMETILKDTSYSSKLWTPVVSRVQKIHNVTVALSALQQSGYLITSDVTANDIVNGHREKIFSLLWQILHDFLAPRYQASAKKIQSWWRSHYFKLCVNERIAFKKRVVKAQAIIRSYLVRRKLKKMTSSALVLQKWFKNIKYCAEPRKEFLNKRNSAIKIQHFYRSLIMTREERTSFLIKRQSAITIQKYYRAYVLMKKYRNEFIKKKEAVVRIQRWFRNVLLYKKERKSFLLQRNAIVKIQRWYRFHCLAKIERQNFLQTKNSAIKIQRWYRNCVACRLERDKFLKLKNSALTIQIFYRNYQKTRSIRMEYLLQKKSAIVIQRYFRAYKAMKDQRDNFIQQRKSAIVIQKWYKTVLLMRLERKQFMLQRNSAIIIQRWFRIILQAGSEQKQALLEKRSAIKIQRWYRHILRRRKLHKMKMLLNAAVIIQRFFRGYITRKKMKPLLNGLRRKSFQPQCSSRLTLSVVFGNALYLFGQNCKLGELVSAYNDLDVCTSFSSVLCLELVLTYQFFYQRLWHDLNEAIRSGPHLNIYKHGLNIVLRLAKFSQTTESLVWSLEQFNGYDILISLMGKFFEKNTDIFCKAATVIWVILNLSIDKQTIKNNLDIKRLQFYHTKIMSKKQNGEKKRVIPSLTVEWCYFTKPVEFAHVRTASEELMKLLLPSR